MMLLLIPGTLILLQALGSVLLTKWASKEAHCVARQRSNDECTKEISKSLTDNFAMREVKIRVLKHRGIIHSEIDAKLLKQTLKASYDLEPSEYKRVK